MTVILLFGNSAEYYQFRWSGSFLKVFRIVAGVVFMIRRIMHPRRNKQKSY